MAELSDQQFEVEKKKFTRYHEILEWPLIIFFFVGIITAALNVTIGGFSPILWLVLSFWFVLIIICMEVSMIRANLDRKKQIRDVTCSVFGFLKIYIKLHPTILWEPLGFRSNIELISETLHVLYVLFAGITLMMI